MVDHAIHELPRIALVYGQEAAVAHVRDAVNGQVDVVYAAAAGEFDVASMHDARASAALVNIDGGDWLGAIEARLEQAGVALVCNDPEISCELEGWERARWLRHLVAKLRGSGDVDPPRPQAVVPQASEADAVVTAIPEMEVKPEVPATTSGAVLAELPLSPEEIETMTVDLVDEQGPVAATHVGNATMVNQAPVEVMAMDLAVEEAAASATKAGSRDPVDGEPEAHALPAASLDAEFDAGDALDVDTEALSAMIDARLAEPGPDAPSDSPQVWRVAGGGAVSPVQIGAVAEAATTDAVPGTPPGAVPATEPAVAVQDDADVLASLPSLDDWALVDHDAPVAATENRKGNAPEPVLPDSFAGLELVPMETITPLRVDADLIERWLDDSKPAKAGAESVNVARAGGGKA